MVLWKGGSAALLIMPGCVGFVSNLLGLHLANISAKYFWECSWALTKFWSVHRWILCCKSSAAKKKIPGFVCVNLKAGKHTQPCPASLLNRRTAFPSIDRYGIVQGRAWNCVSDFSPAPRISNFFLKDQSFLCSSQQVTGCPPVWQLTLLWAAWGEQLGKRTQSRRIKRYETAGMDLGGCMGAYFKRRILLVLDKGISSQLPASISCQADVPWKPRSNATTALFSCGPPATGSRIPLNLGVPSSQHGS